MLEAIYHPYYVPDKHWYKTQLLLWDKIYRIVPHSVDVKFGQKRTSELWDIPEEHVPTRDIDMYDFQYFEDRKRSIKNQLKRLAENRNIRFTRDQHTYLNSAKIPEWVGGSLRKYKLRKKHRLKIWGAEHYLVREDASDFLMSCIAHRASMHSGLSPLTNKEMSCFATFGSQIGNFGKQQPSGESMRSFIAGVFQIMVPVGIERLSFEDVLDIREEYNPLRESAAQFIQIIADEFKINQIIDKARADSLVQSASQRFESEIKKFEKQSWKRVFKDWKTQSIATTLGGAATIVAGGPVEAVALGTGAAAIAIMNNVAGRKGTSKIDDTIQYFSVINERIKIYDFVDGLINHRKLVLGIPE